MSLMKPTPGQRADRASILNLKLAHTSSPLQRAKFRRELQEVTASFPNKLLIMMMISVVLDELDLVNTRLWDANEQLAKADALSARGHRRRRPRLSMEMALDMYRWNRQRVSVIEQLDRLLGEYTGPEKV